VWIAEHIPLAHKDRDVAGGCTEPTRITECRMLKREAAMTLWGH